MKIAIIGYGKIGKIRETTIKQIDKNIEIVTLDEVDSIEYTKKIIKSVDSVIICTPNNTHKQLTIMSLNAGKHVFCEKPPVLTIKEMKQVINAEKISGKKLMYGFNHRQHDSIIKVKQLISTGIYGKILWMRGRYGKSVNKNFFNTWRADKKKSGGGILIDQGIHMLDLFIYISGGFDKVKSFISSQYWNIGIEDNAFIILKNSKTNILGSLHSTMTQWRHLFSLEIFLDKGYFVLNGLNTPTNLYGKETLTIVKRHTFSPEATWNKETKYTFDTDTSWKREMEVFLECIKTNTPIPSGNSKDGLEVMKLIEEIYKQK